MINKKSIFITIVVLCLCCLGVVSFSESNFITIANGSGKDLLKVAGTTNFSSTTLGQAIVIAQRTEDYIAKSGFQSVLMVSKSDQIVFTDKTSIVKAGDFQISA